MAQIDEKQVMIVRQSSAKLAQEFLFYKVGGNYCMNELISTAELLTDWVLNGKTDDVKIRATNLDRYIENKKNKNKNNQ
jgi:hypothetical protein